MLRPHLCGVALDLPRPIASRRKATPHKSADDPSGHTLQLLEKGQQPDLAMPGPGGSPIRDLARAQCLGLHLEIDLRVDVGRVDRDVAKPGANRVDVDAGT